MSSTTTTDFILESLKKQGFSVIILCIAVWHFNGQVTELKTENKNLNDYIRTELKALIQQNIESLKNLKENGTK